MLAVVVPVRDEPKLGEFLLRLHEILETIPDQYIVFVVEGDREELYPDIPGLPHQRVVKTHGDSLERSILTGFTCSKCVGAENIVVCDADETHPTEIIPRMVKLLSEYEMVVASRYIPGGKSDLGLFRNFVSWCFVKWAHLFGSKLTDPMAGFFAVRSSVVEKVKFKPFTWKTCLEIELKARPSITEIPIVAKKREKGLSKAKAMTGLRILWDILSHTW